MVSFSPYNWYWKVTRGGSLICDAFSKSKSSGPHKVSLASVGHACIQECYSTIARPPIILLYRLLIPQQSGVPRVVGQILSHSPICLEIVFLVSDNTLLYIFFITVRLSSFYLCRFSWVPTFRLRLKKTTKHLTLASFLKMEAY